MTAALYIGLGLVVFLVMLNGFLHGAKRHHIDAALSIALVALLGFGFYFQDWTTASLNILGCFAFGALVRPPARATAAWLLSL